MQGHPTLVSLITPGHPTTHQDTPGQHYLYFNMLYERVDDVLGTNF